MKKIILILLFILSACSHTQLPDPLNITDIDSLIYEKGDETYPIKQEDLAMIITYFNQSEPTTYSILVESTERFILDMNKEKIYLTLFKEKDDYYIQNGDDTYLLSHNFYKHLNEILLNGKAYQLNEEELEFIKIQDNLYYNTNKHPELLPTCGTYDGYIEMTVESDYLPNKNNEANFACLNAPYMRHLENTYILLLNEKWYIFESLF